MSAPITNASAVPLSANPGSLPNVSDAMLDWFQNITFGVITKTVVNFQVVETIVNTVFQGVVESMTPQQLLIKPEGERAWNWINVWAYPNLVLKIDDIFTYEGVKYRVMKKNDWAKYGYVQYEIVQDYT